MRVSKVCGVVFLLFFWNLGVSKAQDTRNVGSPKPSRPLYQSYKKEKKGIFSFLKKDKGKQTQISTKEEALAAFRRRVAESYKQNTIAANKAQKIKRREAKKGELFLGHKRPPKKRPPGKQKFCQICRIRH